MVPHQGPIFGRLSTQRSKRGRAGEAGRGQHEEPGGRQARHDDAEAAEGDGEPPEGQEADPPQHA